MQAVLVIIRHFTEAVEQKKLQCLMSDEAVLLLYRLPTNCRRRLAFGNGDGGIESETLRRRHFLVNTS